MKHRATILVVIILLLLAGGSDSFAQRAFEDVTPKLTAYAAKHVVEKIYVQFDKPYYAAGDTIYFKGYVTMGERHNLSKISGVMHVELINAANKVDRSIKLQIVHGVTWGDFALADSLPPGNYRVRGYTRWMRNERPDAFFEKVIPVGDIRQQKVPKSNTAKHVPAKADLQFFAEGGELVAGISSKIAFKAIGANGLGIGVTGDVTDNTGKKAATLASVHLGMGHFSLQPKEGYLYTAHVTYADGSKDDIVLPLVRSNGISLSVDNDSIQKATIKIAANKSYFETNMGKNYMVMIWSGGYATTVKCKLDSPVIVMDIIKRRLFTGVTRITLFSATAEPLCERLIFIQKFDQLNLDINPDKPNYKTREKVTVKLNVQTKADSSAMGHFSVSVTDAGEVNVDENHETTILSDLLLTSDLKGYTEQPNYYFTDITNAKLKDLDLVMLTQGYRRFTWKQVLDSVGSPIKYKAEAGLVIDGTVTNLLGKPLPKARVALLTVQRAGFITDTADDKGNFHFGNLFFPDSAQFVLQAVNAKGKNNTKLTWQKDEPAPVLKSVLIPQQRDDLQMNAYLDNAKKEQEANLKYMPVNSKVLKEVKIKAVKLDNDYPSSSYGGPGHADQVVHAAELEKTGGTLSIKLAGKFHGEYGWRITAGHFNGLIIVDGAQLSQPDPHHPPFNIDDIDADNVETVELFYGANAAIYGMQGARGVLVITTKRGAGLQPKNIASMGVFPITLQGFYKAREFYSPKYDAGFPSNPKPDLRSTIYWNPAVVTDKNGNASFDFYSADTPGSYRIVIEGIDNKGNLGRKVTYVRVL